MVILYHWGSPDGNATIGTNLPILWTVSNTFFIRTPSKPRKAHNVYECISNGLRAAGDDVNLGNGDVGQYPIKCIGDTYQYFN